MKKTIISGFITNEPSNDFDTVVLTSIDGWKFDLVNRFLEFKLNDIKNIQLNYYISDDAIDIQTAKEKNIMRLSGYIDASFETEHWDYGGMTGSGVSFNTTLKIGNHDLLEILSANNDRFIIFEIIYN